MQTTPFAALRWKDLEKWAGSTILARGKNYRSRVHDLAVTEDWHLIADVIGSKDYITHVWLADGRLACQCSCPFSGPCKHGIAVVLTYLDSVKSNAPTPLIEADELEARLSACDLGSGSEDLQEQDFKESRAVLSAMSKPQLIDWIMNLADANPAILDSLILASPVDQKGLAARVSRLRQKIRKKSKERGWWNSWEDTGFVPDYAPIQKELQALLKGGHGDAVLELGEEIFKLSTAQVEESDDDGATAFQLSDCLTLMVKAMARSQRPPAERLIWFWDKVRDDDYGLLHEIKPPVNTSRMSKSDWRKVSDEFTGRLKLKPRKSKSSFPDSYRRQQTLEFAVEALGKAGQDAQVVELLIAELPYCGNYAELVEKLLASKDYEQAERWAREGFGKTIEELPGIAWKLVEQLCAIARRRRNRSMAMALRVAAFLQKPSAENYKLVGKEDAKQGLWQQVRPALLRFLETGAGPSCADDWPLPDTGLEFPKPKFPHHFPDREVLVEIALHEQRPADALQWFQKTRVNDHQAAALAEAAQKTHPNASLGIWQDLAEGLIAKVNINGYRQAMPYLRKIRGLMQGLGRNEEYDLYISALRTKHKAKRLLMAELDSLGKRGRRVVDG